MTRRCVRCRVVRWVSEFYTRPDGTPSARCRPCTEGYAKLRERFETLGLPVALPWQRR